MIGTDRNVTFPSDNDVTAVCIMLGTNDPKQQSIMQELVQELCKKYSGKNIYVQKLLPRGEGGTGFYYTAEEHNKLMSQYNEDMKDFCENTDNVYFIDATDGYVLDNGYLDPSKSSDGCHLDKDRDLWAKNIISLLTKSSSGSSSSTTSKTDSKSSNNSKSSGLTMNEDALNNFFDFTNEDAYKGLNVYYPGSLGQCTWFAWGKFYEIYGFSPGFTGMGYECAQQLVDAHPDKIELSDLPVAGSVFSTTDGGGEWTSNHVGVVVAVDGDMVTIQDGNYNGITDKSWAVAIDDCKELTMSIDEMHIRFNAIYAVPIGETKTSRR